MTDFSPAPPMELIRAAALAILAVIGTIALVRAWRER